MTGRVGRAGSNSACATILVGRPGIGMLELMNGDACLACFLTDATSLRPAQQGRDSIPTGTGRPSRAADPMAAGDPRVERVGASRSIPARRIGYGTAQRTRKAWMQS